VVKGHDAGFEDWPFLSVHFWGEDPTGEWTLGEATVPFLFHLNSSVPDPFLGLPGLDLLVRGMNPDPSIIVRKNLVSYCFVTSFGLI
jgi:hypothetical protein